MSDEMKISFRGKFALGLDVWQKSLKRLKITQSTTTRVEGTPTIGIAVAEALDMGDVTSAGLTLIVNLDPDNSILLGKDVGGSFEDLIEVPPGEFTWTRLTTNAPQVIALVGNVKIYYCIFQNNP